MGELTGRVLRLELGEVLTGKAAEGNRVYFTATTTDLAARCHKAVVEGRWATCMRFFAGPKLLVIDELSYLPLPATGRPRCSR